MRNLRNNALSVVAILAAFLVGSVTVADAQKRNEREIRDAVRSLNSKLDDFDSNVRFQMETSSAAGGQVEHITDRIDDMRDAVRKFENNLNGHREIGKDVEQIVNAASAIDDFLIKDPQNRRVTDAWQDVRRQVDRLSSNYGVKNDWEHNYGVSTVKPRVTSQDPPEYGGQSTQNVPDPAQTVFTSKNSPFGVPLTGTYSIDRQHTENVDDVVASSGATGENRDDLRDKLDAPEQIAIDVRGNQVTLATSAASTPVTFFADGKEKVENSNGRTIRTRATLSGDKLVVSSLGGETDFTITFTATGNGQVLKVSRRITTEYLTETVFAESVYNKTDNVAGLGMHVGGTMGPIVSDNSGSSTTSTGGTWNSGASGSSTSTTTSTNDPVVDDNAGVSTGGSTTTTSSDSNGGYSDNDQGTTTVANGGTANNGTYGGNTGGNRGGNSGRGTPNTGRPSAVYVKPGSYVVPDGAMITGLLENEINTKVSQNGDRFRMTVQSPNEFRGAVIHGYISNVQRSGKVSGAASVTLNFEKITLRDGQSYDFAGTLRMASDISGQAANVDNEGTIRGDSQTTKTAKRGGIGAGLGALIGLIASGGRGAAIGAIIGGGAGAGSVFIQDRKDVRLIEGSTLTIQSAAPAQLAR